VQACSSSIRSRIHATYYTVYTLDRQTGTRLLPSTPYPLLSPDSYKTHLDPPHHPSTPSTQPTLNTYVDPPNEYNPPPLPVGSSGIHTYPPCYHNPTAAPPRANIHIDPPCFTSSPTTNRGKRQKVQRDLPPSQLDNHIDPRSSRATPKGPGNEHNHCHCQAMPEESDESGAGAYTFLYTTRHAHAALALTAQVLTCPSTRR
jgi:hypothetical protein